MKYAKKKIKKIKKKVFDWISRMSYLHANYCEQQRWYEMHVNLKKTKKKGKGHFAKTRIFKTVSIPWEKKIGGGGMNHLALTLGKSKTKMENIFCDLFHPFGFYWTIVMFTLMWIHLHMYKKS